MADELEPIRQNIEINVNKKGVDEATGDIGKLNTTISSTTTATSDLSKENKKAEESFKPLKTQLKEAIQLQQRLSAQYGSTSAEATEAARSVAGIRDEIGLQRDLVNSYNPDDKFRELTQTAGLAALALGGVKDGLTAVGIESEFLDKIIGTAQALLGVTSAIGGISDAYEVLTASQRAASASAVVAAGTTEALAVAEGEATVATWSFNAALLANPAVAIAAAIVALGAGIYAYIKIVGDASKEEERLKVASLQLSVAIDQQAKAFENNSKYLSAQNAHKIALLKASGASEAQIYKETKALAEQELQLAKNYRAEAVILEQRAYDNLQNAKNNGSLEATKSADEAFQKAKENLEKAKQTVSAGYDGLIKLQQDHEVAKVQAQTDADNEARKKAQQQHDTLLQQQKEANKKRLEEEAAFRLKMIELADANETADIEKRIANVEAQSEQIAKEEEDKVAADQKKIDDNNAFFAYQADQAIKRNEEEKARDLAMSQFKEEIGNRSKDNAEKLLAFAASGAVKNKQIQKAAIITESGVNIGKTVSNTATAIGQDLKLGFPANIAPISLDVGVGASSIASILSGTKTALQAVGGGSAPSASAGGVPAPSRNVAQVGFQSSSENQISTAIAKQQKDQPPIQAFVVSQAVTDQQEIDRKKELNNSF